MKQFDAEKLEESIGRVYPAGSEPPDVPAGYRLVAVAGNGVFKRAFDVTRREDFDEVFRQHRPPANERSRWTKFDLYVVTPEQLEKCPYQGIRY